MNALVVLKICGVSIIAGMLISMATMNPVFFVVPLCASAVLGIIFL